MREGTYESLAIRENHYWWHRARRDMVRRLLQRYGVQAPARWLDLGCGTGGSFQLLNGQNFGHIVGVDVSPKALGLARKKSATAHLVRADMSRTLPFADSSFDLVTVFNVLCHAWVHDEATVLAEIHRVLRPGGVMLATEPAFPVLQRLMDIVGMVRYRYHSKEFTALCRTAGLDVLFVSYFTSFGFPLIVALKALNGLRAMWRDQKQATQVSIDLQPLSGLANECMFQIARAEAFAIGYGIRMPFGTTLVCVAGKR